MNKCIKQLLYLTFLPRHFILMNGENYSYTINSFRLVLTLRFYVLNGFQSKTLGKSRAKRR